MHIDYIENLLYEKFYKEEKYVLPEDCGILTASNDYMFPGLQFLCYSLILSHKVNITVVDVGLTAIQKQWCISKNINLIEVNPDEMLFKDWNYRESHIWNKAVYVDKSPYRKTIWIDSDCIVLENIKLLVDLLENGPVFTEDHFAPKSMMMNKPSLYSLLPIDPNKRSKVFINSGVFAIDKERDTELLEHWKFCVTRASCDPLVRDSCAWYDQGALLWAIEKLGLTHRIRREKIFNCPAMNAGGHWGNAQMGVEGYLESIKKDGHIIKHFLSFPKPWHNWKHGRLTLNFENAFSNKVKIFVLGHQEDQLAKVIPRPYLHKVNLNDLPIERFQTNLLAESRIYLASFLQKVDHEYIGLVTSKWNQKYAYINTTNLEDLHQLRVHLKPKNVIVAQRTDNTSGGLGDLDTLDWRTHLEHVHKGIGPYLDELAKLSGVYKRGPSFWANNFICHRTVFKQFLKHWLDMFFYFYAKYKFEYKYETYDPSRLPSFFMEAITINYFSSRKDLHFIEATKDRYYKVF